MLSTPSTSHVNYNQVYEPAEDSYLLLDTLSSAAETEFLCNRYPVSHPAPLVVEIGPGSGVVLAFLTAHAQAIFGRADLATLGVDVNAVACAATRQTVRRAVTETASSHTHPAVFLDTVLGDLTASIKPYSVDVLVFNPPYVPSGEFPSVTEIDDGLDGFVRDSRLLALSTDGGVDGMETTNRLLDHLPCALSQSGVAYILLCAQNKPNQVIARIRSWSASDSTKWCAENVGSSGKKAGWERLCVIRIWREHVVSSLAV